MRAESRSWASATFEGARHRLEFAGPADAIAAMLSGMEEREFAIAHHFVADIVVAGRGEADGGATAAIDALTIEAA